MRRSSLFRILFALLLLIQGSVAVARCLDDCGLGLQELPACATDCCAFEANEDCCIVEIVAPASPVGLRRIEGPALPDQTFEAPVNFAAALRPSLVGPVQDVPLLLLRRIMLSHFVPPPNAPPV